MLGLHGKTTLTGKGCELVQSWEASRFVKHKMITACRKLTVYKASPPLFLFPESMI